MKMVDLNQIKLVKLDESHISEPEPGIEPQYFLGTD